jgi:hypothetical protein
LSVSALGGRWQARRGTAATAVVAVVLLCQATAWIHAAATPHVTCLEHGESVHLVVAAVGQPAPAGERGPSIAAEVEPAAHAHEHCGLQGQRSSSAAAPTCQAGAATAPRAQTLPAAEPRLALRLLRLAPKTSPPAAPVV